MDLAWVVDLCKGVSLEAGDAILKIYEAGFSVEYKSDNSPLTAADKAANTIITSALARAYPDCAILSEEMEDNRERRNFDYCFIVDPLDGTKEFVNRNGQFTVNIALAYKGKSVLGVVYAPVPRELYFAWDGGGAFLEAEEKLVRLTVSDKLTGLTFVGSKSHSGEKEAALLREHSDVIAETVSAGSSLKGCMVAAGKADIYYRYGLTREWDTAAMQCVVEQAGGIFLQMDGMPMRYNRENTLNEKGFLIVNQKENIWV